MLSCSVFISVKCYKNPVLSFAEIPAQTPDQLLGIILIKYPPSRDGASNTGTWTQPPDLQDCHVRSFSYWHSERRFVTKLITS